MAKVAGGWASGFVKATMAQMGSFTRLSLCSVVLETLKQQVDAADDSDHRLRTLNQ